MILCKETVEDLLDMVDNYLEINEFPNERNKQELLSFQSMLADAASDCGVIVIKHEI